MKVNFGARRQSGEELQAFTLDGKMSHIGRCSRVRANAFQFVRGPERPIKQHDLTPAQRLAEFWSDCSYVRGDQESAFGAWSEELIGEALSGNCFRRGGLKARR